MDKQTFHVPGISEAVAGAGVPLSALVKGAGNIRTSKAIFRRQEEYEMDLWVVKYASRRSRIGALEPWEFHSRTGAWESILH